MTSFVRGNASGVESSGVPRDQTASLYVGDLHPDVSELILHQTFSPFGPIYSVRVCRDRATLRSLRYGYVNFVNIADAENAMETLIFQDLLGRPMRIMFSQRDSTMRKTGVGNICIKGLASSISDQNLYDTFSYFGKILSCKVVCDGNKSKGYGFVHFSTIEAAEKAIQKLDGMLFNDQAVSICHFRCFKERQAERKATSENLQMDNKRRYPGVSVYVSNLPYSLGDQQLYTTFSPFGTIINAKVMVESGRSKGFGFVSFSTLEDAATAASIMNGRIVGGRALRVILSHRNEQKTQFENQESSSEVVPALSSDQLVVPPGKFMSAVPQTRLNLRPTTQLALQRTNRQTAVGVLTQSQRLHPPMSVILLDADAPELPRLLVSQMLLDCMENEAVFGTCQSIMAKNCNAGRTRHLPALPGPSDSSSHVLDHFEAVPNFLQSWPVVPAERFSSAVPQMHLDLRPTNQMTLQPSTGQTALGVSTQGECLHPLMSVFVLDAVACELPCLLVSQVLVDYMASEGVFGPCHTINAENRDVCHFRQLLLPPDACRDNQDGFDHYVRDQTIQISAVRPKTSGRMRLLSTEVYQMSASLCMASQSAEILPGGATAPVRTESQQLRDAPHQSPSMWGRWFWMTLDRCLRSRCLSCPTSWSIMDLYSTRRSYKWSCCRSSHMRK